MSTPTSQYSFRLPDELVARIERRMERENSEHPGRTLTRADVVRELLHQALESDEKGKKRRRKS